MKRSVVLCFAFSVLINIQGCSSINARSKKLYPTGTLYPGARVYVRDTVTMIRNDPEDPNNKTEFGREGDIGVLVVCAPIWIPDFLVFTPLADTIMVPYDLYKKITKDESNGATYRNGKGEKTRH